MTDGTEQFRKRAPGHAEDHPDWFLSLSGGVDCTAAALTALSAIETADAGGNFVKKPVAIYLDTRIGVPLNRLYVEQLCDWLEVQLWTLRTDESFLEWLRRDGAPGAGAHGNVKNELKDRQVSKLRSLPDHPTFVLGIAADESDARAEYSKVEVKRRSDNPEKVRHVEVYPVHRLSRKERAEIILRSRCPINPLWLYPEVIKDCGCLCHGDPSELDKTAELFPAFGQRMREWEEAIEIDGLHGTLGWNGLTATEQKAVEDGHEQQTLPMCTDGCQRQRDPAEVQAFRARAHGATVEEAVSILYGDAPVNRDLVAATDGGNARYLDTATERDGEGSQ